MVDTSTIKSRLRISHNQLDSQLADDISAAKAELVRVGLSDTVVNATTSDPLIDKAIIAYCLYIEASDNDEAERYSKQWEQWKDELRKSPGYKA